MARSSSTSSSDGAGLAGIGQNRSGGTDPWIMYVRTGAVSGTSASTFRARRAHAVYGHGASPGLRANRYRLHIISHNGLIAIRVRASVGSSNSIRITPPTLDAGQPRTPGKMSVSGGRLGR